MHRPVRSAETRGLTTQAGKTNLTVRSVFDTVEQCNGVKSFGAVELGHQTLARLAEHLAKMR